MMEKTHKREKFFRLFSLVIAITITFVLVTSCEKVLMKPGLSDDPVSVFEEVWSFTDKHYSFFEYKGIDWQDVYTRYRPFVNENMTPVELFDLLADMLYELRDGHVNLVSPFDRSRYWDWYLDSPENFSYQLLERNYFNGRQRFIGPLQYVDLGDVNYVYYGSFANEISKNNLDVIIANSENKRGLIIDVRNNGGGSTRNASNLASRFTDEKKLAGYNYVKTGPGYNDFRSTPIYIEPHDGRVFSGKVVVLTNRKSYSATTYFTQFMKVLPNVTIVGDTTGGGGGMPAFRDLPNGWLLRVSSTRFYNPEGINIESGIPPHVKTDMSQGSINAGIDDILEKALEILREGE